MYIYFSLTGLALCGVGYDLAELEIKKHNLQGHKKEKGGEENKNVTNIQIVEKTNKNKNQIILPSKRNIFKVEYVFVFIITLLQLFFFIFFQCFYFFSSYYLPFLLLSCMLFFF